MNLTSEEQETSISQMGDNHNEWLIVTDDEMWKRRLKKLGFEPHLERGPTLWFKVPKEAVLVRKPPAKRAASASQLANLRSSHSAV